MRVGLVIYGSLDTLSGGYLYDRMLVSHLERHGDEVVVVALPWRAYPRHLLDNISPRVWRALRRARVDLWLQDELNHPSLFLLNRWQHAPHPAPRVAIVHHLRSQEARPAWQNALYRLVEGAYLRTLDGFIFNSRTTRRTVFALTPAEAPHVVAYPGRDRLGPPLSEREVIARAREDGPLRVLFVGNLIPRKGLHLLLEALAHLPPACAVLDVVGGDAFDTGYAQRVRARASHPDLAQRVRFHGTLPDEALIRLMRESHVLAVPSSYEGFGIVYIEAMGFGLPVIAGQRGAEREIVRYGENGFLVPEGAVDVLAEHLYTLCTDRARLERMSLAALARHRNHPTWEESMTQARAFLHQLREGFTPPRAG